MLEPYVSSNSLPSSKHPVRPPTETSNQETKAQSFHRTFTKFAKSASSFTGQPLAFVLAVMAILIWGVTGPIFRFSDTWQLVINTGTTIVTFLMVFLIQNTQNRDQVATQIKLDELIRSIENANNCLLDLEELEEDELETMRARYEELASRTRNELDKRSASQRSE